MKEWVFERTYTPPRLAYLLRQGQCKDENGKKQKGITTTDLLLIWIIDSLVKPQEEEEACGCFCSNEFLARNVGCHETYIPQRISYLAQIGLLIIIYQDGKRYLEMEWSRTIEEREELRGPYGESCRRTYLQLVERLTNHEGLGKPKGEGLGKPKGEGLGKPKGEGLGKPKHNSKVKPLNEIKYKSPPTADAEKTVFNSKFDKPAKKMPLPENTPPSNGDIPQWCYDEADKANHFLRNVKNVIGYKNSTKKGGAGAIYEVYKEAGGNTTAKEKVIKLLTCFREEYDNSKYTYPRSVKGLTHLCHILGWVDSDLDRITREAQRQKESEKSAFQRKVEQEEKDMVW